MTYQSYYTLRESTGLLDADIANAGAEQTWGFDPLLLLETVEFPNDKSEKLLRRSKAARWLALQRQALPIPPDTPPRPKLPHSSNQSLSTPRPIISLPYTVEDEPEVRERLARLAAVLILQSLYRGWRTRRKYIQVICGQLTVQTHRLSPPDVGTGLGTAFQLVLPAVDAYSLSIQEKMLRRYYRYCTFLERRNHFSLPPTFPEYAATFIQSLWRMWVVRKSYLAYKRKVEGGEDQSTGVAMKQMMWKMRKAGQHTSWDAAARKIQMLWRSYYNRKIYKIYGDMIKFRLRGDPKRLLKFINPQEAALIDASMGAHVRFRLGGKSFPPTIFYKVYVHKALIDMNAFSPRDYTSAESKQALPVKLFDKIGPAPGMALFNGWYRRVENNGWRPVSDKILEEDSDLAQEKTKTIPYHHLKLRRRQEVERSRRQRKLNWLRKLYYEGRRTFPTTSTTATKAAERPSSLTPRATDPHQARPLTGDEDAEATVTASRILPPTPMTERSLEAALEAELEPDFLITWTRALDFDGYVRDWCGLATSGLSEDPRTFAFGLAEHADLLHQHQKELLREEAREEDIDGVDPEGVKKLRPWSGKSNRSVRDLMITQREMADF
ncbi:uncharacterized protein EV422DRAFT_133570 [Fimicolochytrium jonesii]|uniref:uncharacterized protein n=1 Tax=Fimicolochytrium jonesii TaxID=1396493 RepID=UPI0022FE4882|nr:uncharacterized protein EV422DRAFT_133570 [Fimicolochytrium jonesii]KAI8825617.1 hypothetical protein EV422DRAFT_133570 [Fimicolochytrium jonesii]